MERGRKQEGFVFIVSRNPRFDSISIQRPPPEPINSKISDPDVNQDNKER